MMQTVLMQQDCEETAMTAFTENKKDLENDIWLSEEFDLASKNGRERYFRMQEQLEAFKTIAMVISADTNEDAVVSTICSQTQQLMHAERTTLLAIGPESGYRESEVDAFLEKGFQAVTLGDHILRVEFALAAACGRLLF